MSAFDPVRARRAWCLYDWANSGFATVVLSAVFPIYFLSLLPPQGIPFLAGHTIQPAALWGYLLAAAMLVIALGAPQLGALADRRDARRRFWILFTLTGGGATTLLGFADIWPLAAALFLVANVSFAASTLFYNAFLPDLAQGADLDTLSSRGYALGYLGGGLMLLIVFVLVQWPAIFALSGPGPATRLGLALTGLWWLLFAIPGFRHVRPPRLAAHQPKIVGPVRRYLATFRELRRYPDLARLLFAYLLYNDGVQTCIAVSAVFAREELRMPTGEILAAFLMIQFVAMPGSLACARLAERTSTRTALFVTLTGFLVALGSAYVITASWQFWGLALLVALVLGGSQALSRSLYASLLPPARTAEFFGLYAISAKFSAVLGPLSFALLVDLTGSLRLGIVAISLFLLLGMALLGSVNIERGRRRGTTEA